MEFGAKGRLEEGVSEFVCGGAVALSHHELIELVEEVFLHVV